MANVDYKWAFKSLVHTIIKERELWDTESVHNWERSIEAINSGDYEELHAAKSLEQRYAGMADLCKYLLNMAASFEGVPHGSYCQDGFATGMEAEHLDANGMVSLHLYKWYDRNTCMLDLSCPEGEQPERVYHEVMQTIGGLFDSGVTVSVDEHMYEVRYNGEFGVPLDNVKVASDQYVWVNDEGQEVNGPDVIFCHYYDTALSARPVA